MAKLQGIFTLVLLTLTTSWSSTFLSEDGPIRIEYTDPVSHDQVAMKPAFTQLNIVVSGNIAQAQLRQLFVNPTVDTIKQLAYVFPMPWKSSVHAMSYQYGGNTYVAGIFEKEEAVQKFDSLTQTGAQAALLLETKPSIFKQQFANLLAGDSVWIDIVVSMPVQKTNDQMEITFPTMVADRYGDDAITSNGYNPEDVIGANTLEINTLILQDRFIKNITSPSHDLDLVPNVKLDDRLEAKKLKPSDVAITHKYAWGLWNDPILTQPNKDFVLRWQYNTEKVDFTFNTWKSNANDTGYFMLDLSPDLARPVDEERGPVELILLMDKSGSQSGWPMDYQKKISYELLDKLIGGDRLQVITFSDDYNYLWDTPVDYSGEKIAEARLSISHTSTGGGTNLLGAIDASLSQPLGDHKRIYVFLTDGFITNEAEIFNLIRSSNQDLTLFTFGAGNSVNRYFLDEAAEIGNGFSTVVLQGDDPAMMASEALSKIESPQLSDLRFTFDKTNAWSILKPRSKNLYLGSNWQAYGKYTGVGSDFVTMTGNLAGEPWSLRKEVIFHTQNLMSWSIPKIWAREKILALYNSQENEENKDKIIEVSLKYSVLSPYTAFLAFENLAFENLTLQDEYGLILYNSAQARSGVIHGSTSILESEIEDWQARVHQEFAQVQAMLESHSIEIQWNEVADVEWAALFDLAGNLVHLVPASGLVNESYIWHSNADLAQHYVLQIITKLGVSHQKVYF